MSIDPLRHLSVFNPVAFGGRRVDIIGCGATGSRVALSLAKLGVSNINIWDFDKIEDHNIPNQLFGLSDVGKYKVTALKSVIKRDTGTAVTANNEAVDGSQPLGEIVFLLVDTMSGRKEIWEKGLKMKLATKLVVETRMGADNGRVYAINPCNLNHIKEWEKTLYSDEEAEVSACGSSITVGPTADVLAGMAVWQMVKWFNNINGVEGAEYPESELIWSLRPFAIVDRKF